MLMSSSWPTESCRCSGAIPRMGPLRVLQYFGDWLELANTFCEPLLPRLLGRPMAGGAAAGHACLGPMRVLQCFDDWS